MKKILLSVLSLILVLTFTLPLASCKDKINSEPPKIDDIRERLVYLIEESKELNVVFFGKGLPVYVRESEIADRKMVYFSNSSGNYDRVTEQSEYKTPEAIKIAAEKVYSKDYLSAIYESAFDGVMTGSTSAYVRFYDSSDGFMQNTNATVFKLEERIYDYSTMQLVEPSNADYINVEINSYTLSDKKINKVYLSFIYENGNWYLDSPSY